MTDRLVLLSLHPQYGRRILAGTKIYELRRRLPKEADQRIALLYLTSPDRILAGVARVKRVLGGTPDELWGRVSTSSGVSRDSYDRYFQGAEQAFALELEQATPLPRPFSLLDLRRLWPHFQPPQSFRYLYESLDQDALTLETPWGTKGVSLTAPMSTLAPPLLAK